MIYRFIYFIYRSTYFVYSDTRVFLGANFRNKQLARKRQNSIISELSSKKKISLTANELKTHNAASFSTVRGKDNRHVPWSKKKKEKKKIARLISRELSVTNESIEWTNISQVAIRTYVRDNTNVGCLLFDLNAYRWFHCLLAIRWKKKSLEMNISRSARARLFHSLALSLSVGSSLSNRVEL